MSGKIDRLELDRFLIMVDTVIEEEEKKIKGTITETTNSEIQATTGVVPEIIGEKPSNAMIILTNEKNEIVNIYSNAAICAREHNVNPTTIRKKSAEKKTDEKGITWGYLTEEQYNQLKNK